MLLLNKRLFSISLVRNGNGIKGKLRMKPHSLSESEFLEYECLYESKSVKMTKIEFYVMKKGR